MINRQILRLALPNIITNITIPLLGLVELAILGHLGNSQYLAAIALGTMIFNFIYWAFAFLRMATSGFVAQAYGARKFGDSVLTLQRGLITGLGVAFLLILLQPLIIYIAFRVTGSSASVKELTAGYLHIRIFDAPATLGLYVITGWFLGMQNSRFPMIISLVVNTLNIAFNLLFVFVFNMNIEGVAWGTLIAQYAGFVIALVLFWVYYRRLLKYSVTGLLWKWKGFIAFFKVNANIFIRMICVIFVMSFFTIQSSKAGDIQLAVNSLLLQFLMVFSFFFDGFGNAAEALIGKHFGARNQPAVHKTVKVMFIWGLTLSIIFTTVYFFCGNQILALLTNEQKVLAAAKAFIPWAALIPVAAFAAFVWDGIYIGALASAQMRNTLLWATLLVYFPVFIITKAYWGNFAIWLAFLLYFFSRGVIQTLLASKVLKIK